MKILQSSVFRALCSVAVGILLVSNPDSTVKWITVVIGVMFFLSGVISLAAWFVSRPRQSKVEVYDAEGRLVTPQRPMFPIVGLGSALLGLILMFMPGLFVTSLMYVLGAIIMLGAVSQLVTLASLKRTVRVPFFMWVCPSLILLAAIIMVVKPMETAALPLLIAGWCLMLYGVVECVNAYAVYKRNRSERAVSAQAEAEGGAAAE